jgi:outer membrane lipoprotein SlyB
MKRQCSTDHSAFSSGGATGSPEMVLDKTIGGGTVLSTIIGAIAGGGKGAAVGAAVARSGKRIQKET